MDRSWMTTSRVTEEYQNGLTFFLDYSFRNASINGRILCPCKHCKIGIFVSRDEAFEHLTVEGFIPGYTQWIAHGELPRSHSSRFENQYDYPETSGYVDDMQGLVHDVFGVPNEDGYMQDQTGSPLDVEIANGQAREFYKLIDASQQNLYEGCEKYTKLSFMIRLLHIKCLGRLNNNAFDMLLELLREAFPDAMHDLPKSYYEAEKLMKELGLGYEKIDACSNDCTLYWGVNERRISCETCQELRWRTSEKDPTGEKRKIAHKVMWYFPLKPRLQRLFMSAKTASHMRWHAESRTKDGNMRHPADSPAWKTFDSLHPEFAEEPRNVRLGLASDGFNPFKSLSTNHSTWPVILVLYNFPPGMCMKQPYNMLSILIPGPSEPGNNIDIYLQPLIADLKDLWEVGVETYDASKKQNFQLRASLLWTISDFPGYANLSGWSTKGKFACPVCDKHTHSLWLRHGGKYCYMGHRRFLPKEHEFRKNEQLFDGTVEFGEAPPRLSGDMVMDEVKDFSIKFGKHVGDNLKLPFNWKKKSIFFDLPYWKDNVVRHNLDFMHIEKNVCESICGTLLEMDGKSKDNYKSRLDLQEMRIRPDLHPISNDSGKVYMPPASYTMNRKERTRYLGTLKSYVRNMSKPEGSIVQGYLAEECLTFCSLYLADYVESKINRVPRNEVMNDNAISGLEVFTVAGRALGKGIATKFDVETLKKAHQYVLFNCEAVTTYIEQYCTIVEQAHPHVARHQIQRIHSESFADWFAQYVEGLQISDENSTARDLKLLSGRPNFIGLKYKKFLVNGFRFHTKALESKRKTQNCGVRVKATTSSFSSIRDPNPILSEVDYYGILTDIIELDYGGGRRVVLFDCDWVSKGSRLKQDAEGFTLANFSNVKHHNEPFILASQAEQVFYVQDPTEKNWHVVVSTAARAHCNMESTVDVETYLQSNICNPRD